MKTVITQSLGLGLCCKLRLWLVSFSSSQIFQSGFVFLCLKSTSYVSQWQVSACNYLCTSHSMPHKKGYQISIFKTNELLVNTFEAINQRYHFLSTDRDIVAFKFLHGARHRSGFQPLLVCPDREGCRWRAMGSDKCPLCLSPSTMVYVVSDISWWHFGADRLVALSRSVCICSATHATPLRPVIRAWQLFTLPSTSPAACKGPSQDFSVPCQCLDAAAVPQGQWHLAQAKATLQARLTAAKGPIKQPRSGQSKSPSTMVLTIIFN